MSYISLKKSQLLDSLENQVLYADLCCVVIGQDGIGKTFFIQKLNSRLNRSLVTAEIDGYFELTVAQLEKSIALQLELSWNGSENNLIEMVSAKHEKRVLIIVDNAHLLDSECLEYLITLVNEQIAAKETNVFVVLCGEPELAQKLNNTQALQQNPDICAVFELQPIDQIETKYLIAEFQELDVGAVESIYDEQKLNYFWQLSHGVPGQLSYHLNRWLIESEDKSTPQTLSHMKRYLLAAGYSLIALILILILVYQDDINQSIEGNPITEDSKGAESISIDLSQERKKIPFKTTSKEESSLSQEKLIESVSNESQEVPLSSNGLNKDLPISQEGTAEKDYSESTSIEGGSDLDEEYRSKDKLDALDEIVEQLNSNESVARVVEDKVLKAEEASEVLNELPKEMQHKLQDSNNKKVVTEKQENNQSKSSLPIEHKPVFNKSENAALTEDEEHLKQLQDSLFTLQWGALSTFDSAQQFKNAHPLKQQMYIYRRKQNNKFLYLIVSGAFNSRDDAENAQAIYSRRNYPGKTWIKSLKTVKQELSTVLNP